MRVERGHSGCTLTIHLLSAAQREAPPISHPEFEVPPSRCWRLSAADPPFAYGRAHVTTIAAGTGALTSIRPSCPAHRRGRNVPAPAASLARPGPALPAAWLCKNDGLPHPSTRGNSAPGWPGNLSAFSRSVLTKTPARKGLCLFYR